MTFNFERLFSIMLYCDKCKEELTPDNSQVYVGGKVYECKNCKYKIFIEVKE